MRKGKAKMVVKRAQQEPSWSPFEKKIRVDHGPLNTRSVRRVRINVSNNIQPVNRCISLSDNNHRDSAYRNQNPDQSLRVASQVAPLARGQNRPILHLPRRVTVVWLMPGLCVEEMRSVRRKTGFVVLCNLQTCKKAELQSSGVSVGRVS
jgi:hypothetical protein